MSAEATGWVWKNSTYSGATLIVHAAIADSVNDQNENEFWMSITNLAKKARVNRTTASLAVAQMVDDGCLELLEDNSNLGKPSRYRFEFPQGGVVPNNRGVAVDDRGVLSGTTGVLSEPTLTQEEPKVTTQEEPKELFPTPENPAPVKSFLDLVWDAMVAGLHLRPNTPATQKRFGKCRGQLVEAGASPESIIVACDNYRAMWPGITLTPEALVKHYDAAMQYQPTKVDITAIDWDAEVAQHEAEQKAKSLPTQQKEASPRTDRTSLSNGPRIKLLT